MVAIFGWSLPIAAIAQQPVVTTQPTSRTVVVGDNHTFTVVATGDASLVYQWRRNNLDLANQTNASLSLSSIQTNDAGVYAVVITNLAGSVTSSPARLTVRLPSDPAYPAPQGGWTYVFQGDAIANSLTEALDGSWDHQNDSWSGDGR
jgi:hypothetical protein